MASAEIFVTLNVKVRWPLTCSVKATVNGK